MGEIKRGRWSLERNKLTVYYTLIQRCPQISQSNAQWQCVNETYTHVLARRLTALLAINICYFHIQILYIILFLSFLPSNYLLVLTPIPSIFPPVLETSFINKRWPFGTSSPPILGHLIRITFIHFRKFSLHDISIPSPQMPCNSSCLSLKSLP